MAAQPAGRSRRLGIDDDDPVLPKVPYRRHRTAIGRSWHHRQAIPAADERRRSATELMRRLGFTRLERQPAQPQGIAGALGFL